MSYFSQHLSKCGAGQQISIAQLEPGMIISAVYKKQPRGKEKGGAKKYILLVLNPNFRRVMHALSLDLIPLNAFNLFAGGQGIEYTEAYKSKKVKLRKLIVGQNPKQFYAAAIRKIAKTRLGDSYRTLNIGNFNSLRVVNYEFSKNVLDAYLPGETDTSIGTQPPGKNLDEINLQGE